MAVDAVRRGDMGKNAACRTYNISKPTLLRHLKKERDMLPYAEKHLGRHCDLPKDIELDLVNHIKSMAEVGFGFTITDVRKLAFEIAETNHVTTRFDSKTKIAGLDWYYGFIERHRTLSLRSTEATSIARASGFNRPVVSNFFILLGRVLEKYKFTPESIYNVDESGYTTVHKTPKVVAAKTQRQVPGITSQERGRNITVACCTSGHYVPPLFIFPRVRMKEELVRCTFGSNWSLPAKWMD